MALDNLHNVLLQLLFFIILDEKIFAGRRESKEQERKKGLLPPHIYKLLERQLYLIISNNRT